MWMGGRMDGWTGGRMGGWTGGRVDGWTGGRMDGWTTRGARLREERARRDVGGDLVRVDEAEGARAVKLDEQRRLLVVAEHRLRLRE